MGDFYDAFLFLKIVSILANSADSDEMPQFGISSGSSLFVEEPAYGFPVHKGINMYIQLSNVSHRLR